jgi:hypothetical protein
MSENDETYRRLKKRADAARRKLRELSKSGSYTHACNGWLGVLLSSQSNAEYSEKYLPRFAEMVAKAEDYLLGVALKR